MFECLLVYLNLVTFLLYLQCENGWYGVDCSVPSVWSSIAEWPRWLRPGHLDVPESTQLTESLSILNAVVPKKRPLIYIYDLPPEFNSLLLEASCHQTCNMFSSLVKIIMLSMFSSHSRGGISSLNV